MIASGRNFNATNVQRLAPANSHNGFAVLSLLEVT